MILLTGSTGFIGRHYKEMYPDGLLCPPHKELDLTNQDAVRAYLRQHQPRKIIHCASNDSDVCLYDNLRMFNNLAESEIPMVTFCTGREVEDRSYKNGEYVLSKKTCKELALNLYNHIAVVQLWGCFGEYEKDIRFFKKNMLNIKRKGTIFVEENKMFSYVYVKDLVEIVESIYPTGPRKLYRPVAYTDFFSNYAMVLSDLLGGHSITSGKECFSKSYVGLNNVPFVYTPLKHALKDMWNEVCLYS